MNKKIYIVVLSVSILLTAAPGFARDRWGENEEEHGPRFTYSNAAGAEMDTAIKAGAVSGATRVARSVVENATIETLLDNSGTPQALQTADIERIVANAAKHSEAGLGQFSAATVEIELDMDGLKKVMYNNKARAVLQGLPTEEIQNAARRLQGAPETTPGLVGDVKIVDGGHVNLNHSEVVEHALKSLERSEKLEFGTLELNYHTIGGLEGLKAKLLALQKDGVLIKGIKMVGIAGKTVPTALRAVSILGAGLSVERLGAAIYRYADGGENRDSLAYCGDGSGWYRYGERHPDVKCERGGYLQKIFTSAPGAAMDFQEANPAAPVKEVK